MKNISSKEAFDMLANDHKIVLIDVRRQDEWISGIADIKNVLQITWHQNDEGFINELQKAISDQSTTLLFMCKAGIRSAAAASQSLLFGYKNVYNVLDGFDGWKNHGFKIKINK